MSDSSKFAFSMLSNWKFGLAVCVPCFAVGMGVTYYYYSKTPSKTLVRQIEQIKKLGNAEFTNGNFDAAIMFYTQALSVCPESETELLSVLFHNRAAAYSNLGNNKNCVADCDRALALVPNYRNAIYQRARALVALENFKLALDDITFVLKIGGFKNETDIWFANGILKSLGKQNLEEYMKNNAFILPSKTFIDKYMISFCDDPFNDEFSQTLMKSNVNTGLELALKCIKNKNYDEIEEACKEELNKTDNSLIRRTLALNLLATFSIIRGDFTTGIEHLTTVIETSGIPNKLIINSLIKRASVYHQQEQVEKIHEDLKLAENIDPNSSDIFFHRANIYLIEKDFIKAIDDFKRAYELNHKFVLSFFKYCYAQFLLAQQKGNELGIKKYLRKLKEFVIKYPKNSESNLLYSQALTSNGAFVEADSLLKKAHKIHPDDADFLVQRAVVIFLWKHLMSDAVNILEQALNIDPKCKFAYDTLGKLYMKIKKSKEAVECLEKLIPLTKSYKELLQLFMLRDSNMAYIEAHKRLR